jgi:hypothetical protein
LAVLCLLPNVAAGEYELFTDEALGVALEAPPGYEVEKPARAEGVNALTLRLSWREGPYAGLDVVVVRRDAGYANVVIWAGLYQRRLGASSSFEAEAEPLSKAELEMVGAEDGVRVSYEIGEGNERRRLKAAFLALGKTFYRLEISYPASAVARLAGAAQKMMDTFEIFPAVEGHTRDTNGIRENGEPVPAE